MNTKLSFYFTRKSGWRVSLVYLIIVFVFLSTLYSQQGVLESKIEFTINPLGKMETYDSTRYYHSTLKDYVLNRNKVSDLIVIPPDIVSTPDSLITFSTYDGVKYLSKTINEFNEGYKISKQSIFNFENNAWRLYSESNRFYDPSYNLILDSLHIFHDIYDLNYTNETYFLNNKRITDYYSNIDGIRTITERVIDSTSNNNPAHLWHYKSRADTLYLAYEIVSKYEGANIISILYIRYDSQVFYDKNVYGYHQGRLVVDTFFRTNDPKTGYDIWGIYNYYYNNSNLIDRIDLLSGSPLNIGLSIFYKYDTEKKLVNILEMHNGNRIDTFETVRNFTWSNDDLVEFTQMHYDLVSQKYRYANNSNFRYHYVKKNVATKPTLANSTLNVYPNPFIDFVTIEEQFLKKVISITIKDLYGRIIQSFNPGEVYSGNLSLNPNILPGYYFLEALTKEGLFEKKIIKI